MAGLPSERTGIEFTNDYRPASWIHIDADLALTRARFLGYDHAQAKLYQSLAGFPQAQIGNAPGNYVFNAPWMVASAGITLGEQTGSGHMTPLGYDAKDRKIAVNAAEAERVRTIFRGYLKLGSLNPLMADLRKRGILTKVRKLKTGERVGGIAFTRGSLAQLLRNRFYIGEVSFKGEIFKGEQPDDAKPQSVRFEKQHRDRSAGWRQRIRRVHQVMLREFVRPTTGLAER